MNIFSEHRSTGSGTGRVLRVKEGFNPNSSSLGSIVFSMHVTMTAVPVLLAGAAAWIAARMGNKAGSAATSGENRTTSLQPEKQS